MISFRPLLCQKDEPVKNIIASLVIVSIVGLSSIGCGSPASTPRSTNTPTKPASGPNETKPDTKM